MLSAAEHLAELLKCRKTINARLNQIHDLVTECHYSRDKEKNKQNHTRIIVLREEFNKARDRHHYLIRQFLKDKVDNSQ